VNTLAATCDDYVRRFRPRARAEARHFASGTLTDCVRKAALAQTGAGRKYRHQWRIPPALLAKFAERLASRRDDIACARSFAELLAIVESAALRGIGELTVYDTAVRLGARRRIEPEQVYLHAGTRHGAARLGLNVKRPSIPRAELPSEWADRSPAEVEDLLCSYAPYLGPGAENFRSTGCDHRDTDCGSEVENCS